jgi:type I restriction enzyme, S subunit
MPQNIGDNVIIEDGIARIGPDDAARLTRYLLQDGDIIYSRRGDVERRALVRPDQGGWLCGTGCLRVRLRNAADPQFMSYYLGHPDVREWIVRHAIGATMPNLNTRILESVPITLPPRQIQLAIAAILGALDDKIAVNNQIVWSGDELRTRRLDYWMQSNPEMTKERPLSSLAEFVNGRAFTKDATGAGRMVIRIAEINSGPGGSTVYSDIKVPDVHLARPGNVLFAWSGSLTVARWFRPEAIINQHIFKVIPNTGVPVWLAFEFIRAKLPTFKGIAAGKATTMGHIQRHHLDECVLSPVQDRILGLDAELGPLWERALAAEQESLILAELRDGLLPGLMSGEIRVRDAEKIVGDAT